MMELLERGGGHSWLALLSVLIAWTGALLRALMRNQEHGSAAAGGWLMLGGALAICLSAATLVLPHTSVLMTLYEGLGPPLLIVMGMSILIVLDGVAEWASPPPTQLRSRAVRWGVMALLLAGLGLLMEVRSALSVHLSVFHTSLEEATMAVERWYTLARNAGAAAALIGIMLLIDGLTTPLWSTVPDETDEADKADEPPA